VLMLPCGHLYCCVACGVGQKNKPCLLCGKLCSDMLEVAPWE
jgi:hypothetical protein